MEYVSKDELYADIADYLRWLAYQLAKDAADAADYKGV
jgi:DNA-directed RNA polymerase specialized sigma24 family protein